MKVKNNKSKTQQTKQKIATIINKVTKNISKPNIRFITNVIQCFISSSSTNLSSMSKNLISKNKLLSDIQYFSRKFKTFNYKELEQNELPYYKKLLPNKTVTLILDKSDIIKPASKCMENLSKVQDGSDSYKTKNGYFTSNVLTFTKDKNPLFLYGKVNNHNISTPKEDDHQIIDKMDTLLFDRQRLYLVDSGYSGESWLNQFIDNNDLFITRTSITRVFDFNGNKYTAEELLYLQRQKWFNHTTIIPVKLDGKLGIANISYTKAKVNNVSRLLNVIIINASISKGMILITNKECDSLEDAKHIYYKYLTRWKIETSFKFIKQQFQLEKFRVRKFQSIKNLYHLILFTYNIFTLLMKDKTTELYKYIIECSQSLRYTVSFQFYQLVEGIKNILVNANGNIYKYI